MQVRRLARGRLARIDDDQFDTGPALPGLHHSLKQHRVAPGGIRAHQDDEIGQLEILVAARHEIRPEGAFVPGDGGGHA